MAMLSEVCKLDNLASMNSLKLSFTNIQRLRSIFDENKSSFEANSPATFLLYVEKLG